MFIHETGLSESDVARLFVIEKKLSKYNELECSEEMTENQTKIMGDNRSKLFNELKGMIRDNRAFRSLGLNSDPRGPAIRFTMTSNWYNCPDKTLTLDED